MNVIRPWRDRLVARSVEIALAFSAFIVRALLGAMVLLTTLLQVLSRHLEARRVSAALEAARTAKSANRWRVAFEAAPTGMARVGVDGRVEAANAALCRLMGEPARALVGRRLSALVYPDDLPVLAGPGKPGRYRAVAKAEVRLVCAGGRLRWCEIASSLVEGPKGRPDHVLVHVVDITRHKRSEAALRDLATRDPLSGLANRRWFELQLVHHLKACAEESPRGALLVIDLDNFKSVNDTMGHEAGDRLVIEAALTLRRHLRDHDLVARLGGDEFAVVLAEGDRRAAEAVARKLVLAVRDEVGPQGPAHAGPAPAGTHAGPAVTASIGVAAFEDLAALGSAPDAGAALKAADEAMYLVKRLGRNGYALAGASDGPHLARPRSRAVTIADLRATETRAPMASTRASVVL